MRKIISVIVLGLGVAALAWSPVRADRPTAFDCVIDLEPGEPAQIDRIRLYVADFDNLREALVYCRDVIGGHPEFASPPKRALNKHGLALQGE